MKQLFLVLALITLSVSAFSQEERLCSDDATYPCVVSVEEAHASLIEMMLTNPEGMKLIQSTGTNGLILHFSDIPVKMTILSLDEDGDIFISRIKYEVELADCYGTDTCTAGYRWTVVEEVEGDGYMYKTTYTNALKKIF